MRPSYFIFSLPRSGTAWLSLFLSTHNSYCYHEPTADHPADEWATIASKRPERVVGAVDTGAMHFADSVWSAMPQARFFCLYRSPYDIKRSSRWNGFDYDAFGEQAKLKALKHEPILYSKLDDIGYLEELWARVVGTRFDEDRAKTFLEMRVERDIRRFFANRPDAAETFQARLQ